MKEIIRIYELKEDLTLEEGIIPIQTSADPKEFDLTKKVMTGRHFSVQDMENGLLIPSLSWRKKPNSPKAINGSTDTNDQGDIYYDFTFNKDCTMSANKQSIKTKELIIKIPFAICKKFFGQETSHSMDPDFLKKKQAYKDFIAILQTVKNKGKLHADIVERHIMFEKQYRLEKRNRLIQAGKIAIGTLAVGFTVYGISKIPQMASYIDSQQQKQREQEIDTIQSLQSPKTISELQQQRISQEQDPQLQEYLNQILEEHEKLK